MYCNVSSETLQPVVLTGASHPLFATTLATQLQIPLIPIQSTLFADGTHSIDIQQSLHKTHALIVQSIAPPIHDSFLELLLYIDHIRHSGAERITVVCPFFGFRRNAEQLALSARLLRTAGVHNVIVMDMHEQDSAQIFEQAGIQFQELSAIPLLINEFTTQTQRPAVLITPDAGAYHRLQTHAQQLALPVLQLQKYRIPQHADQVFFRSMEHHVQGKDIAIIDDEINTGATMIGAAAQLKKSGAASISLYATHGIFSADAQYKLAHSPIHSYSVTNTLQQAPTTRALSVVHLFAEALTREIRIFQ